MLMQGKALDGDLLIHYSPNVCNAIEMKTMAEMKIIFADVDSVEAGTLKKDDFSLRDYSSA